MHHECLLVGKSHQPHSTGLRLLVWGVQPNWPSHNLYWWVRGMKILLRFLRVVILIHWTGWKGLISKNLGHGPKVWVGHVQIISLTWSQVLHNHTVKCNLRCSACCHCFRFLSLCEKLLRCSDVLHIALLVCVLLFLYFFYFFISSADLFRQVVWLQEFSPCGSAVRILPFSQ